jgi:predicted RNase H-like HicB family nuclease
MSYNQDNGLTMPQRGYTVLFEPAEEGGFVATCPALPGLVTEGDTLAQARAMVQDAIRAYLESLRQDGLQPPEDIVVGGLPASR